MGRNLAMVLLGMALGTLLSIALFASLASTPAAVVDHTLPSARLLPLSGSVLVKGSGPATADLASADPPRLAFHPHAWLAAKGPGGEERHFLLTDSSVQVVAESAGRSRAILLLFGEGNLGVEDLDQPACSARLEGSGGPGTNISSPWTYRLAPGERLRVELRESEGCPAVGFEVAYQGIRRVRIE